MIEELDMSKLGWTEKLILRIEKGLKEDEKQIELALKPKELGNLKNIKPTRSFKDEDENDGKTSSALGSLGLKPKPAV